MTRFIAILALLLWSGTKPAIFPRYACIEYPFQGSTLPVIRTVKEPDWVKLL
uniref:Uncharacterized protein n=1 Tax=Dromaius novaehollandiae TaxID=8790 RepID=A0A8C4P9K6_DRONO